MNIVLFFVATAVLGGLLGTGLRLNLSGRHGTFQACALIALIAGIVSGVAGRELGLSAIESAPAVVLAVAFTLAGSTWHQRRMQRWVAQAPELREYGLTNFDRLDHDGDGIVSRVDLVIVSGEEHVTDADRQMIDRILSQAHLIGHAMDTVAVVVPSMIGHVATYTLYGITPSEFESYPDRLQAEFERDFGAA